MSVRKEVMGRGDLRMKRKKGGKVSFVQTTQDNYVCFPQAATHTHIHAHTRTHTHTHTHTNHSHSTL